MEETPDQLNVDSSEPPQLSKEEQFARIREICQPFYLKEQQLQNIKNSLLDEIHKALKVESNSKSSVKCLPTYVQEFPCGCEHGRFLVLELKENNFHISLIHLRGAHNYHSEKETHEIPKDLNSENVEEFFKYLVDKLGKFLKRLSLNREQLSLSVCFPFPLRHTSLKSAVVQKLNKNLNIKNLVGRELVELLQNAINRNKDLLVNIESVLCNCTAILLANSWQGRRCNVGINIGTGCNAVYVERITEIEMCSQEQTSLNQMVVNTEWGEFGANGQLDSILTVYDKQVDLGTRNNGQQIFEKLTSGFYLGELARQIFLQCIEEKVLFHGYMSQNLKIPFSFTTRHVCDMLSEEDTDSYSNMRLQFDKLGISKPDVSECSKVYYILRSITNRSAMLVACGIASLAEKIGENHIVLGLGGSFYLNCHLYSSLLQNQLKTFWNRDFTYELSSLENGVAIGSALLTAISKSKEFIYQSEDMIKLLQKTVSAGEN